MGITPSGHFAKLYQFLVREPARDSDIDTVSGSFLLRIFDETMQNTGNYPLKLMLCDGKLQDFVYLNQKLNFRRSE